VRTVRANFIDLMSPEEREVMARVLQRVNRFVAPDRPPLADLR
jgi:hypothetical protein